MKHTKKQQRAIDTQSRKVIVSAAAGSGKTSVLTQRVIRLVMAGTDIRQMLVMTFTRAAAAEMRRRIFSALSAQADKTGDKRLYDMAEYVSIAEISTFHSFCARVCRENFSALGLLPNFRIMSDYETAVTKKEAADMLFEKMYEEEEAGFARLLKRFTKRAADSVLFGQLMRIYDFMLAMPEPLAWARQSVCDDIKGYAATLEKQYASILRAKIENVRNKFSEAYELCRNEKDDSFILSYILAEQSFAEELLMPRKMVFTGMKKRPAPPKVDINPIAKQLLEDAIAQINEVLSDKIYADFREFSISQLENTHQSTRDMAGLLEAFHEAYGQAKRRKNALDYSDLEHFALLALKENAAIYKEAYPYVFVDEYQDTSRVQEEILKLLYEGNHVFMVGDIKQSIYRFRMADPGIFKARIDEYQEGGDEEEIILMNENFRSEKEVISAVNFLMDCIMCTQIGEIEYTEGEKLIHMERAETPAGNPEGAPPAGNTEILLCDVDAAGKHGLDANAAQAHMIAESVQAVLWESVTGEDGKKRKAKYSDIAILMRSRSTLADSIKDALMRRGIPCSIVMRGAKEIHELDLIANVFKLIDNPANDIALLSVMRSFIGGFDENDFAEIRITKNERGISFFEAAKFYAEENEDNLGCALRTFFDQFASLRLRATGMSLEDFVPFVLRHFEFGLYISCLPGGNLKLEAYTKFAQLLQELAGQSGNSLFRMLLALAEIKKRDPGYIGSQSELSGGDAVRILSIHYSKGLEFPIVYLAGLNKKFNDRDLSEPFLLHSDFGMLPLYVDEDAFVKKETLERALCKTKIRDENRSEELRMLYVAMTRAREQLYLTGYASDLGGSFEIWKAMRYADAKSMMDWVMAANEKHGGIRLEIFTGFAEEGAPSFLGVATQNEAAQFVADVPAKKLLHAQALPASPAKVSVSEIKRNLDSGLKSFMTAVHEEEEEITGAALGTLLHTVMERVVPNGDDIAKTANDLFEALLITEEELGAVLKYEPLIRQFLSSDINARIKNSQHVIKEQPFNLKVPAGEIGYAGTGDMLVQGILDLAFMEGKEWVLLDYKTDRIAPDGAKKAAQGYAVQLELYAKALTDITHIPVRQKYIYFMRTGNLVSV